MLAALPLYYGGKAAFQWVIYRADGSSADAPIRSFVDHIIWSCESYHGWGIL